MKTLIRFLFCATLFYAVSSRAQWHSTPSGTTETFYGSAFADTNTAYLAGWDINGASIYKTTDGGESFSSSWHDETGFFIFGVHATDPHSVIVSGYDPTCGCALLLQTYDDGITWTNSTFSSSFGFYSIEQTDPTTFLAAGYNGKILKTVNSGKFWSEATTGTDTLIFRFMSFGDVKTGYALAGTLPTLFDKIFKTTDGGSTWALQKDFASTRSLGDIKFIDAQTGFYVGSDGQDAIYKTTNGGSSWKRVYHGTESTSVMIGIRFQNAMVGYAANQGGRVLKTTDGGDHWVSSSFNDGVQFGTLAVSTNGKVLAAGVDGATYTNSLSASVFIPKTADKDYFVRIDANKLLVVDDNEDQITEIIIHDILGRELIRKNMTDSHEISLASLHSGTYFWNTLHNGQEYSHGKVIVE